MSIQILVANESHHGHAQAICTMIAAAAQIRGTGIAQRQEEYICRKMTQQNAILALHNDRAVGFCYIETWSCQSYVANSGLIVHPDFRRKGLARAIKNAVFELSKQKFPNATLFGITTNASVMKINTELGYQPVTFASLTQDNEFWNACQSCPNYDILTRTKRSMCLCTAMICEPQSRKESLESRLEQPVSRQR
ncbi:MAG: GNAT family N-acetyltransferase [Cytophagales bacterium]|nr:GNAT family N-acetyltransferase [Cytophagales bacterium]